MVNAIINFIIGVILIKYVPGWIKYGDKKVRNNIQLVVTVVGVLFLLAGIVSIIRFVFGFF
jgi:hypothetical protein